MNKTVFLFLINSSSNHELQIVEKFMIVIQINHNFTQSQRSKMWYIGLINLFVNTFRI